MLIRKCIKCRKIIGVKFRKPWWKKLLCWEITGTLCDMCLKEKRALAEAEEWARKERLRNEAMSSMLQPIKQKG